MNDKIIELDHVTKYFDQIRPVSLLKREHRRVYALKDVRFSVEKGEFAAYAGPNGAGKSTTFKLLCGMLKPQEGSARLFGTDPCEKRIEVMRRTGILFGNRSELWWDHPVRASFEWKKAVWRIDDEAYARNASQLRELLELDGIWNSFARELSLGQRMRADLALALLHGPELVLLDEPTLGLDVLAKRQMIGFLKRINREKGVTMLVTSHDMDDLTEMANRLILIRGGEIAFDGTYEALIRMTGDARIVKLCVEGAPPVLSGAELKGEEDGAYVYRYDAEVTPPETLFRQLSGIRGVTDLRLEREGIETVIAGLYRRWNDANSAK